MALVFVFLLIVRLKLENDLHCCHTQGRTGPPGYLAHARWAGWSAVQVGRHDKCWSRL